ncbi:hypothetical protein SB748_37285, partial [Rhizobium sp. SIMBA_035]
RKGDVTFMDSVPANRKARERQAEDRYALAEQLQETDVVGAEQAYRMAAICHQSRTFMHTTTWAHCSQAMRAAARTH